MKKGRTYHRLLSDFIDQYGTTECLSTRTMQEPPVPACAKLRLSRANCHPLADGRWRVDLIVKPDEGPAFHLQPLKICRNEREAEILARYAEKVMEGARQAPSLILPSN